VSRRSPVSALLLSSHPAPAAAVSVVALTLAIAVGLEPWRVLVVTLAFVLNQLSIGWSNDWVDVDRDRLAGRTDKPVARGDVSVRTVRTGAFLAAGASILLAFLLGPPAGLAHAVFVVSAWAYNLGLKATPLSVLPYLVSFGLLPAVVTLAAAPPRGAAWWALLGGALLGVAAHFTNVLPDLEDDRRTGIRGLPHRMGLRAAGTVAFAALLVGAAVVAAAVGSVGAVVGAAVVLVLAIVGIRRVLARRITRVLFGLVLLAALVLVAMLATGGGMLAAG
jgi:4-hydroxybenzoate polyprenyltransferase